MRGRRRKKTAYCALEKGSVLRILAPKQKELDRRQQALDAAPLAPTAKSAGFQEY
jgi:hypothetical protein